MSFIPDEDLITKGFLKPSNLKDGVEYKLKIADYKREKGGRFPDKDGYSTTFIFQAEDSITQQYADDTGLLTMNCNSARLRKAFAAADCEIGDIILLSKKGKGFDTDYFITKLAPVEEISVEDTESKGKKK